MTIKIGDKMPDVTLKQATATGPIDLETSQFFKNKTTVLFAIPGAFTPVCSSKHLPGFITHSQEFLDKGVDQIACLSVNDPFVLQAWSEKQHVKDSVTMLADGNGEFTKAIGLGIDLTSFGMGYRSQRYAIIVKDGMLKHLDVEPASSCNLTSAEHILSVL
jgi:peroxiredoxin